MKLRIATSFLFIAVAWMCAGQVAQENDGEITLSHRLLGGCGGDSCYWDFFNMWRSYGYGLSLQFGNDHGENEFSITQMVGEVGLIADMGLGTCEEVLESRIHPSVFKDSWEELLESPPWRQLMEEGVGKRGSEIY